MKYMPRSQRVNQRVHQHGFTLVEIAIVVAIIGLLIGGMLRGQELINSARARNIIDQKASIQTAMVAFSNRYKAMPGDLTIAQRNFIGSGVVASTSGAGNGLIAMTGAAVTNEAVLFFQNLSATSFLSCTACMSVTANAVSNRQNSPLNVYGDFLQFGTVAGAPGGVSWLDPAVQVGRNALTTGASIGSDILREVDIKADDGEPASGLFRQSTSGGADATSACAPLVAPSPLIRWVTPAHPNCAGAWLF